MKKKSLLFTGLFLVTLVNAQYCFTEYKDEIKDYTGFNSIHAITESPQGDILAGGESSLGGGMGLLVFDGITAVNYKTANSDLPGNIIFSFSSQGDSIWIGTDGGLVGIGDFTGPWKVFSTADGLPSNEVTAVYAADNGMKWLGFSNGQIASISLNGTVTTYNTGTGRINDIIEDNNGRLWAAENWTSGGNDHPAYLQNDVWVRADNDQLRNFKDLEVDSEGHIWGNSFDRLMRFDPVTFEVLELFDVSEINMSPVLFQTEVLSNQQLVLSTNYGLLLYKNGTYQLLESAVSGVPEQLNLPVMISSAEELWYAFEYSETFDYAGLGKMVISDNGYSASPGDSVDLCLGSMMEIDAGTGYDSYHWNGVAGGQTILTDTAGIYQVSVDDGGGCFSYDTIDVRLNKPYEEQDICVVTVDEGNVIVAWERTYGQNIWYTNIYRETDQAGIFEKLDSIFIDDIQAYVDPTADPQVKPYTYRISVTDSCGNESGQSDPHTTVLLLASVSVTGGANLYWSHYQGQDILSYEIYRGPTENTISELVDVVSKNINTYVIDSPDAVNYIYQVEAVIPNACDPTAKKGRSGPFTRSVSNLKSLMVYDLELTDTTLTAAAEIGSPNGKFILKDGDGEPIDMSISLAEGEGDIDNDKFMIRNDSLFTNYVFPFNKETEYSFRVRAGEEVQEGGVADWIFTIKVDRLVGMPSINPEENGLKIYPNPSREQCTVTLNHSNMTDVRLTVYDLSGRIVKQVPELNSEIFILDLSGFIGGIYLVELRNAVAVYHSRLLIK